MQVAFWNSDTLRSRLPELISDYEALNVVTGSYELGMGSEAYVTGHKKKTILCEGGQIVIPPGQFALLLTEERVRIPLNAVGFISIKSTFKLWGLINVSGFHVDPGFDGKLIFSAYNAGVQDIVISRRKRVFLLWLCSFDAPAEGYQGSRNGQDSIPDEDMMKIRGEIPSPSVLLKKIDRLQNKVTTYTSLAGVAIGLCAGILLKILVYDPHQTSSADAARTAIPSPTSSLPAPTPAVATPPSPPPPRADAPATPP